MPTQNDSKRPVVMHVIDSLDISGGAERQLVNNLTSFDQTHLEHRVVVVRSTANSRESELENLVPVTALFESGETASRSHAARRLLTNVRRQRPSLIHASLPLSSVSARFAGRMTRTKVVESLVNISHEPIRTLDNPHVTMTKLRAHTLLDRMTMRHLSGFHAVSEAVGQSWVRVVGLDPDRIRVIPRGIEVADHEVSADQRGANRAAIRDEFGLDPETFVVVAVGRVEPQKGHRYLVEATAEVVRSIPGLHVLIVGRPGLATPNVEETIASLGVGKHITLTGPRRDLPRILSGSDMFAFPSLFEGNGGNAMIEAMAAGLPIVTTGEAPMTDLIPDESVGLLVPRAAPAELAAAITRLFNDSQLRSSLGASAKARTHGFPNPAEISRRFEDWYRLLLGR